MEPVSNADRLVLLLRQKLEERAKTSRAGKDRGTPRVAERVPAVAAVDGTQGRLFRRVVVQQILAEQFGKPLVNDANFQQIVSRISDAIEEDREASQLLSRAIAELNLS